MAEDREDHIRQLAYRIWEREGRPHGREALHWHRAIERYEAHEAELAGARRDDAGQPIEVAHEVRQAGALPTPMATSLEGAASLPATRERATSRKRRTRAVMEAAPAAEVAVPKARRGSKPQSKGTSSTAETSQTLKRKRRTKAEMAAAAAGVAGAAAAVVATVAATKRRRNAKAKTADEPAPAPAADVALRRPRKTRGGATLTEAEPTSGAVASGAVTGSVPDPSADEPSGAATSLLPDPGAEPPSESPSELYPVSAPEADPSGERVAD